MEGKDNAALMRCFNVLRLLLGIQDVTVFQEAALKTCKKKSSVRSLIENRETRESVLLTCGFYDGITSILQELYPDV